MTEEVKTAAVVTEATAAEKPAVPQEVLDFACELAKFPQVNGTVSVRDISNDMVGALDAQGNVSVSDGHSNHKFGKESTCR